jgi:hypothetical protein
MILEKLSYLVPVDANNLYGDAMSFKLPCKAFKWCTTEELKYLEEHLLEIPNNNGIGYTLKVSLDYPKELHDKHNDYPFSQFIRILRMKTYLHIKIN